MIRTIIFLVIVFFLQSTVAAQAQIGGVPYQNVPPPGTLDNCYLCCGENAAACCNGGAARDATRITGYARTRVA
jgi:hypothetical protein